MAEPATWGLIISAIAAGVSAISTKNVADFNETMANQDAEYAVQLGEVNAAQARRDYARRVGETTVVIANSGSDLLASSSQAAFAESAAEHAEELEFIKLGAQADKRGSLIKGSESAAKGNNALLGGALTIGGSLVGNADKITVGVPSTGTVVKNTPGG